jgi:hypothetical protein
MSVSAARVRQRNRIDSDQQSQAFRGMTLLLAVCETTMASLDALGEDGADTLAAVTALRDHLAVALDRFALDPSR